MKQIMAPEHADAGAPRVGEHNHGAQVTEAPLRGGASPAVSHQLRAPLTSIMSRAELVRRRLDQEQALSTEWLRLQVAAMYEAAESMVAAIDELSDTARLHRGHPLALQLGLVEVGALVSGVARALNETHAWCRVAPIAVDAAPQVLLVGDRPRLERVLRTVLGYVAACSPAAATVQVMVQSHRDTVTIVVQEGDAPLPAPERGQKGWPGAQPTGLAAVAGLDPDLASACRIVEQHGGHLRLAQARGQDATAPTVSITLPRTDARHDGATRAQRRMTRAAS